VKIDDQNFEFQGDIQKVIFPNPNRLGWEVRGDYNTRKEVAPWLEGPWMTKHKGKYYLQYAAPGTLEKSYADGVYVSDQPLGDFELQAHNPFALKPEGFICGAGHGSTFQDEYQNLWHAGTMVISVKEKFERRLGLFPTFFDGDDVLFSSTRFGDYPMVVPFGQVEDPNDLFTGWMLLSYKKPVTSSSTLSEYPERHINDENVRSIWSAKTGDASEWVAIDLEQESLIHAIQLNFAEVNSKLLKRPDNRFHAYKVEGSLDGEDWFMIADRSKNQDDRSHQYLTFDPVKAKHVKVNSVSVPDGNFAMMGLRIFGIAEGKKPKLAGEIIGKRNQQDPRDLALSWSSVPNATGYNIRYGIDPEKLYRNHLVYDSSAITIRSLDSKQDYYFAIEAFNESGVGELSQTSGPL
ncbi:MAG: discoidin domain-containing protein, partial [Bacteroidota bacterium]